MFFRKKEVKEEAKDECKPCNHDECYECHHLIAKGSGQKVILLDLSPDYYRIGLRYGSGGWERTVIFCDLHKKPYDKFESEYFAAHYHIKPRYFKRVEPWQEVNEDGSKKKGN